MSTTVRSGIAKVRTAVTRTKQRVKQVAGQFAGKAKAGIRSYQLGLQTPESKLARAEATKKAKEQLKRSFKNILVSAHTRGAPNGGGGEVPVRAYYRGGARLDSVDHMKEPPSYLVPIEKRDPQLPPRNDQLPYPILEDTLYDATIIYTDRKGFIMWLSPEEYLRRIPSDPDFGYKLSAYDAYMKGSLTAGEKRRLNKSTLELQQQIPQDIIELDYRNQHGNWPVFENKWAAMAAFKLGIKKIPVGVLIEDRMVPESKLYVPEGAFDEVNPNDTTPG